jgi:hypothetical protein
VRTSKPLLITMTANPAEKLLQINFNSDSLDICGDLAQDLFATHLRIGEVDAQDVRFPIEMRRLTDILSNIEQQN